MVPLEWLMITLWLCFGIVGLARQFPRELGATIAYTGMLLAFDLAASAIGNVTHSVLSKLGVVSDQALVSWGAYTLFIAATVTVVYVGETLSYSGTWTPGPVLGRVFDVFIGLFNGWIVVGTWWYFTDKLGYPIQQLGLYQPPLSPLGQQLVHIAPLAIIPDQNSYILIVAFLLLLLGLKVIR